MAVKEITLETLDKKIGGLSETMKAEFNRAFERTQGGFASHNEFAEFVANRVEGRLSTRLDRLATRFDQLNDHTSAEIEALRSDVTGRFDKIDVRFNQIDSRFNQIERRFDRLEERLFRRPKQ